MALQLCITVESINSHVRNIFANISSRDLPCHKALLLASELPTFYERLNEEYSSQLSGVVELWFLDSPSLFSFLFRCIGHEFPHIWPYTIRTRLFVSSWDSPRTMCTRQVAFRSKRWILWTLSMHPIIHLSSSRCTKSQTVRAARRIISYSGEVHRRYQNDSYILGCIDGETYWNFLECGWRKRILLWSSRSLFSLPHHHGLSLLEDGMEYTIHPNFLEKFLVLRLVMDGPW